jgi:hypothetical protein
MVLVFLANKRILLLMVNVDVHLNNMIKIVVVMIVQNSVHNVPVKLIVLYVKKIIH